MTLPLLMCWSSAPAADTLHYTTSWVGNSGGNGNVSGNDASSTASTGQWVQNSIEAIHVAPDGRVFANTPWDEGFAEISVYANGKVVGQGTDTHGWGNSGGEAIAGNDRYLFAAMQIGNEGGGLVDKTAVSASGTATAATSATTNPGTGSAASPAPNWPPRGRTWFGVTRRLLRDPASSAPFAGGIGNRGRASAASFLLVNEVAAGPDTEHAGPDGAIRGMAADAHSLVIANTLRDRIEIYDPDSMRLQRSFAVQRPGKLALAADRSIWVLAAFGGPAAARLEHYSATGQPLPAPRMPSAAVRPVDLALDAHGTLLVADGSANQQILYFTQQAGSYTLARTFGARGGLFGSRPGVPGPARFDGLVGIGVDAADNLYVATNGYGPRPFGGTRGTFGSVVESYAPGGQRRWQLLGLLFADGLDVDPADPTAVFSGSKRFTLDDPPTPGRDWTYAGSTANRFKYPQDAAFNLDGGWRGQPMVRRLNGKRFLFLTDMYSGYLKIYRFDEKTDGEVAIPSGFFARRHMPGSWPPHQPARGEWLWRDSNGDGRFDAGEFHGNATATDAPDVWGWWVDSRGDVWQATTEHGIRQFRFGGLDAVGNPIYSFDAGVTWPMPTPFTSVHRAIYDAVNDVMYVTGYSAALPYDPAHWKEAGRLLARYDHWRTAQRSLRYAVPLHWQPGTPVDGAVMSVSVAGAFVFAVETYSAVVHVIDAASGRELGLLKPGPEVGGKSGWVDMPDGLHAWQRPDGSYRIAVEDDMYAKVILYRWNGK